MGTSKRVIILIPAHKKQLTKSEQFSLVQCHKVLGRYPIRMILPEGLDSSFYKEIIPDVAVDNIPARWLSSHRNFNRLMLDPLLFDRYADYKYILFYELDALVFRDELEHWCDLNYDYIGAPQQGYEKYGMQFLNSYKKFVRLMNMVGFSNFKIRNVGNSGLSLRKVKSHIRLLKLLKSKAGKWPQNVDTFFTYYGNMAYPFFKLPDEEIAAKFSIEKDPEYWFKKNKLDLPFGCHGWDRRDASFWKQRFVEAGIDYNWPNTD